MIEETSELFDKEFQTREQLVEEVKKFYKQRGYALTIKDSRKDRYVTIGCDRGGIYRDRRIIPTESRLKDSSTRLIKCPFQIYGKRLPHGSWSMKVQNNFHNHEPSVDINGNPSMAGHPSVRRLTGEQVLDVENMSMAGIRPWQILSSLRQSNPELEATSRTIYNAKAKIRLDKLDGRSSIKALFDELGHGGFTYNYKNDSEGRLTHVFFSHPKSIMLSKTFSTVFVIDCTHKTNRFKMPLLNIIGVSSFNKSFYSCISFMAREKEEDYIWALEMFASTMGPSFQPSVIATDREVALINAIRVVFPATTHLLCVGHIEKNIVSNCKRYFKNDWDDFVSAWNAMVYADTEEEFNRFWVSLQTLYGDKRDVINYIKNTWIPYKEHFVSVWTDKYAHFGNRATSRAEGAHSKLKGYLQVSTGDFRQVRDKICLAIDNEFHEIKTSLAGERIRVPHKFRNPFFRNLVGHVSIYALHKLYEQFEMAKLGGFKSRSTGHFQSSMGLPCAHMMSTWKEKPMSLVSIHMQWRIDTRSLTTSDIETCDIAKIRDLTNKLVDEYQVMPTSKKDEIKETLSHMLDTSEPILFEPRIKPHRGRPPNLGKRKESSSSTRREQSQFEIVEATLKKQKDRAVESNLQELYTFGNDNSLEIIDLNEPASSNSLWFD